MAATRCCWPTAPRSPAERHAPITGSKCGGWTGRSSPGRCRPGGSAVLLVIPPAGIGTPGGHSRGRPFQRRYARPSCPVSTVSLPTQGELVTASACDVGMHEFLRIIDPMNGDRELTVEALSDHLCGQRPSCCQLRRCRVQSDQDEFVVVTGPRSEERRVGQGGSGRSGARREGTGG